MSRVAFLGLGVMGRPMAVNLVRAGHQVTGWSRSEGTRQAASEAGVPVTKSIAEAIAGAEVVITMLPDSPEVLEVCLSEGGVLQSFRNGTYIDMSTIAPATSRRLFDAFADRGVAALDAPVSGGEQGAVDGTLSIMVGGDETTFAEARPLLGAMGTTVAHLGPAGSGQTVKAANQLMVALHLQALAEATTFLRHSGSDVEAALGVIANGLAGSTVLDRKTTSVINENYAPGFRAQLHLKDLGIVQDAARELEIGLPATAVVSQLMQFLVTRGGGDLDHAALAQLAGELNQNGQTRP